MPPASHFIFIPGVLLIGIVIGWILGSRAAADAYAAKLRRDQDAQARAQARATNARRPTPDSQTPTGGA
jgi:hypothetical protein